MVRRRSERLTTCHSLYEFTSVKEETPTKRRSSQLQSSLIGRSLFCRIVFSYPPSIRIYLGLSFPVLSSLVNSRSNKGRPSRRSSRPDFVGGTHFAQQERSLSSSIWASPPGISSGQANCFAPSVRLVHLYTFRFSIDTTSRTRSFCLESLPYILPHLKFPLPFLPQLEGLISKRARCGSHVANTLNFRNAHSKERIHNSLGAKAMNSPATSIPPVSGTTSPPPASTLPSSQQTP
jgi:hypothetical protein